MPGFFAKFTLSEAEGLRMTTFPSMAIGEMR